MKRWLIPVTVLALTGAGVAWAGETERIYEKKVEKVEQKGTTVLDARSMVLPLIASVESADAKSRAIFALGESGRPDLKAVESLADLADKDVHLGSSSPKRST